MTTEPLAPPHAAPTPPPPPVRSEADDGGSAAAPRRRPLRLGPRSLTGRLVTGVVALVFLVVLATAVGTFVALRSFLFNRLDQQVQSTANGDITGLFQGGAGGEPVVRPPQGVWSVALAFDGSVIGIPRSPSVQTMELGAADRRVLAKSRTNSTATVQTTDDLELRVTVRELVASPSGRVVGVAVVGLSTEEVRKTLRRLLDLELVIGSLAILAAFLATYYGVRFSLRRLHGVTRTAREVAAELSPEGAGLDRRVAVTEPDTEVGQLAESMNTLLSAVETQFAARVASEERMRQFLADASHELRTPLTSIRGYAELARMQRRSGQMTDDGNLERIEFEGTRMSRLVEDLLTLARSDQATSAGEPPPFDEVDVAEVVVDAVEGVRAAYPERRISVDLSEGLVVRGDSDQLQRVVRNLVTNAAVHTRPDGPVDVRLRRDGDYALIQVVDAGPGLPPEQAVHVFERFWRADKARSRASGGSGLGMAIVAAAVQAHGGTVRFDSTVERGSTVSVWLPLGAAR